MLVVVALKDSSAKGYPGKEEDSNPDLLRKSSLKVEKGGASTGMEQQMMKLTLGITGSGKDGEDYSIPLNVSRPRSGSGSRYLTDKVRHITSFVLLLAMNFSNDSFTSHQFIYVTSKWSRKIVKLLLL